MASSPPRPKRLLLGSRRGRLRFERRIQILLCVSALPSVLLGMALAWRETHSWTVMSGVAIALALLWAIFSTYFFEQLIRPLQTLTNVVAALREDDFSFRARGGRRGDALGDLAIEINALAGTLQRGNSAARDALTLVERVMTSMQSPVLVFDATWQLRLSNEAARTAFELGDGGVSQALRQTADGELYTPGNEEERASELVRWSVRRSTFRLHGVPHTLLVLADVAAVLREEERLAWQRLIRVLSHEINNSLTPIKSLAGSLRVRLTSEGLNYGTTEEFGRGLTVIEERAASLHRFLQAYGELTRLPPPRLERFSLRRLLERVVPLEDRVPVHLEDGPDVQVCGDPDQLQQLFINLLRNAAEASLLVDRMAKVDVSLSTTSSHLVVRVADHGPGLTNPANLFVPFYTTKPEGSGIGLVLAQQIAAAHRGSLTLANNASGAGCTAELRLPHAEIYGITSSTAV